MVDAVVIGSGPAGMAAANAAATHGSSVLILDETPDWGGQIYRGLTTAASEAKAVLGTDYERGALLITQVVGHPLIKRIRAEVWQIRKDEDTGYIVDYKTDNRLISVHAKGIVVATGALERPFPIPGWTLPGVLTAGAAQVLLKGNAVVPSEPPVLVGCGPLLYLIAAQLIRAGVKVEAIVDTTTTIDYLKASRWLPKALGGASYLVKGVSLLNEIRKAKVRTYSGAHSLELRGVDQVQSVVFKVGKRTYEIKTQLVLLHQGVIPNTQMSWAMGLEHSWDVNQICWVPETNAWGRSSLENVYVAGDSAGIVGAIASEHSGYLAGLDLARSIGLLGVDKRDRLATPHRDAMRAHLAARRFIDVLYRPKDANRIPGDTATLICRCEEVTVGDVRELVEKGCTTANEAKSLGRCGMGPCQGRECGVTISEFIAKERACDVQAAGYYRIRFPIKPITLSQLATLE